MYDISVMNDSHLDVAKNIPKAWLVSSLKFLSHIWHLILFFKQFCIMNFQYQWKPLNVMTG